MIQKFYSKLNDKERKIFYFALGAIVLSLFDALFLRPVQTRLKRIDHDISEKKNSIFRDMRILSYQEKILQERKKLIDFYPKKE